MAKTSFLDRLGKSIKIEYKWTSPEVEKEREYGAHIQYQKSLIGIGLYAIVHAL